MSGIVQRPPRTPALAGRLLVTCALMLTLAVLAVPAAWAASGTTTATPTPTFPVPASAKPQTSTATTPGAVAPTTTTPAPGVTAARTTPKRATRSSGISTPAIVLAVLAALLVLAAAGWAVARQLAFEPRWVLSLRHSLAEAGFRASATWAELTDWARLGR